MENGFEASFCPYDDGLLLQFILSEILVLHQKVNHSIQLLEHQHSLKTISQYYSHKSPYTAHLSKVQELSSLEIDIKAISRATNKLKHNTYHLQRNENRRELQTLRKATYKARLCSAELNDLFYHGEKPHLLAMTLAQISSLLPEIRKPIAKLLGCFAHNENVIYFLLIHQQSIDNAFGKGFTLQQFEALHGGLNNTTKMLIDSYTRRRFDKVIISIMEKASSFETKNETCLC